MAGLPDLKQPVLVFLFEDQGSDINLVPEGLENLFFNRVLSDKVDIGHIIALPDTMRSVLGLQSDF